jgi:hypothetical protein
MIRGPIGDQHVESQQQSGEAGGKANDEKQATEEFKTSYEVGIECRKRDVKAGEEANNLPMWCILPQPV